MFEVPTKNSAADRETFLKQAHEARLAREMKRKTNDAITTIQAFYRSYKQRNQLRKDLLTTINSFKAMSASNDADSNTRYAKILDLYRVSRVLMLIFNPCRDKSSFDIICQCIIDSMLNTNGDIKTPADNHEVSSVDIVNISSKDISKNYNINRINFASIALDKKHRQTWLMNIEKILHVAISFIGTSECTDSTIILNYITILDIFSSMSNLWIENPVVSNINALKSLHLDQEEIDRTKLWLDGQSKQLLRDLVTSALLYSKLNLIMSKVIKKNFNHQRELLELCTKVALKPLAYDLYNFKTTGLFIANIMSIPCLIHYLENLSPASINQFHEHHILRNVINALMPEQDFRIIINGTSDVNLNLFLLANLIHLAMIDLDDRKETRCDFVIIVTRFLEHFKGYLVNKQSGITHWHPIFGWFSRNIDSVSQETMDIVKTQLYFLWNIKFIKVLFADLIETNESKPIQFSHTRTCSKLSVETRYNKFRSSLSIDSSSPTSFNFIKKVVVRATSTMNKSLGNTYIKTSNSSCLSSDNKLMCPLTNNVAMVCYMYHICLNTLTETKRDILAGLCLHDFVLPNLWHFIQSLGPNNGLKAFLDHLTICTKTNSPEFYILILFCECAIHLISILDDTEVYEKQKPFCLDDLIVISAFLNNFVFRVLWNNLIAQNTKPPHQPDTLLMATHTLLNVLYKRDCRRNFTPPNFWIIKDIKISSFMKDLETGKGTATKIMKMIPHILPHKERVLIFRRYVSNDRAVAFPGPSTQVTIHRSRVVENGYQQLARLPPSALKGLIRVKFINEQGLDEAGVDQNGVFKEFLEDTIKRVFDPTLNLFKSTSEQRLYPSPTSHLHRDHLSLFEFVGKMLGKAVYEGIVVDVPFASFFLGQVLGQQQSLLYSWIDELPSLDPELYKSLTYIKHYEGDVSELELTFSIDQDILGKIVTYELEPGGRSNPVTKESRVKYIHSVAKFRMHRQIHEQTAAFIRGFRAIINPEWISMFSTPELQRLISGDNNPIDIADLKRHTKYFGGFHSNHRVINWLWDILEKDFSPEEHRMFLKFITSCSKPPLLGFANLEPPFTIRCVEVSDDQDLGDTVGSVLRGFFAIRRSDPVDRLPTSSTCFNLLKLPNYQRRSTLREKLRYAIRSNAGFELS